ncbi:hypothetical protein A2U01_0058951, partial [Trifolium medium]|nr:hypothetical protein [Trifolium medium]
MVSSSQINNDGNDHTAVDTSMDREQNTVLSPVQDHDNRVPESDPRDGFEASLSSEDDEDLQILSERQIGKRPQNTQEIPVDNAQHILPVTNADIAALLAALKQTT